MNILNAKERDIVLFLGAGFSRDAALPLITEAGDPSRKDNEDLLKHAKNRSRNAAETLIQSTEIFRQFQRFCKQSPTLRDTDVENVENIFCIAEAMSESGLNHIELDNREYEINELIRHIRIWFWKIYHQLPLIDKKREKEVHSDVYERFFKALLESKAITNVAVITTNYDLVFEYLSFCKYKMPCYYPLNSEESESICLGGGTKPFAYIDGQDDKNTKGPLLCKLHGSINYFQDGSDSDILYVANLLGGGKPIGKSGDKYWKDKPAILAVDAISDIWQDYGNNLSPAIITPTYAKLTRQNWLRNIWYTALHILSKAKKIIFIGYRMPDSDGFMRALIHSALAIRASRPNFIPPQVFVIDPSPNTHQRYQELFHETYKLLSPLPFSEATKSVIPEILQR